MSRANAAPGAQLAEAERLGGWDQVDWLDPRGWWSRQSKADTRAQAASADRIHQLDWQCRAC